jgi:dCTP deaminase
MGFIAVKFTYKKLGLINISGFHVDPGYKGKLIFSVYNVGPNDILIRRGQPVFSIFFQRLTQDLEDFNKDKENIIKNLNLKDLDKDKLKKYKYEKRKGYTGIPLEMILPIHGPSKSITMYNDRIEKLEHNFKLYGAIALAVIGALVGVLLTKGIG